MSDPRLWFLADMLLNAVAVGIERQVVLDTVKKLEAEGKSAEQIADAIKAMRDEAINKL